MHLRTVYARTHSYNAQKTHFCKSIPHTMRRSCVGDHESGPDRPTRPPCPLSVPLWTRTASAARAGIGLRKHQAHSVIKEVCTGRCRPSQAEGYS